MSLLAMTGQPAIAAVAEAGAEASAQTRNADNDITVIGKSYGREVGKTPTRHRAAAELSSPADRRPPSEGGQPFARGIRHD